MKWGIDLGIGGVIGLLVGIFFAGWVNPPATPAYVTLIALSVLVFSALARFVTCLWAGPGGPKPG